MFSKSYFKLQYSFTIITDKIKKISYYQEIIIKIETFF